MENILEKLLNGTLTFDEYVQKESEFVRIRNSEYQNKLHFTYALLVKTQPDDSITMFVKNKPIKFNRIDCMSNRILYLQEKMEEDPLVNIDLAKLAKRAFKAALIKEPNNEILKKRYEKILGIIEDYYM